MHRLHRAMVCLLLAACAAVHAETTAPALDTAALDRFVEGTMARQGLGGVALAITRGTRIVYQRGYGTAAPGRPMQADTPMYIGSQSKSITALALAQLAGAGRVDLSAPVRTYLPDFAVDDPVASQQITLLHLLHHTSGLSDAGHADLLPEDASLDAAVRSLRTARLTAPVGQRHQYFNLGYAVLMRVIEGVSGQSYADYVRTQVFAPLRMSHSFTDPRDASRAGLAQGYSRLFGLSIPVRQPHRGYQLGTGFLMSSATDLAHLAIALQHGGRFEGTSVLSPEATQRLFVPDQGYAMGWYVSADGAHAHHGGANETFRTSVELFPRDDIGIVLLINQGYMLDHFLSGPELLAGVTAVVYGQPAPAPSAWRVPVLGAALLALVLALAALHLHNFRRLRGWAARTRSPMRRTVQVAVSFAVPSVILCAVYVAGRQFWGDRFNLAYQLTMLFRVLPDVGVLMVLGTVPDYMQGAIKLWQLRRPAETAPGAMT
jgi:CubicO group peptidase (beta-lactamase class C family)